MAVVNLRYYGDPVLSTRAEIVTRFDETLKRQVSDMFDTMDHAGGVGLAANQIGMLNRVFVYRTGPGIEGAIINPVWEPIGDELVDGTEGCLSIPGVFGTVRRHKQVIVRGRDTDGRPIVVLGTGLLARCIQHESDHLDGRLYLQYLEPSEKKQAMATIRNSEWFTA